MLFKVLIQIVNETNCLGEHGLIFVHVFHEVFAHFLILKEFFLNEALLFGDHLGYLFVILSVLFNQLDKRLPELPIGRYLSLKADIGNFVHKIWDAKHLFDFIVGLRDKVFVGLVSEEFFDVC